MCLRRTLCQLRKITFRASCHPSTLNILPTKNWHSDTVRSYCNKDNDFPPIHSSSKGPENKHEVVAAGLGRYEVFRDDSIEILDVEEERLKNKSRLEEEPYDEFSGINLARGVTGVFEIDELVEVLQREKAQQIFVTKLPPDINYVNYIVIVSGKSHRHMKALAEFTRRVFKKKMHSSDLIPRIEGENSQDWIAMDLGNIALHIFSKEARAVYDLESLWSVGSEFDELCNKPEDPLVQLLERHSVYLGDLKPADTLG